MKAVSFDVKTPNAKVMEHQVTASPSESSVTSFGSNNNNENHETSSTTTTTPRCPLGLAIVACLQNAAVGGLVLGWANIDRTLLAAPISGGGAGLSLLETTQIFSWASGMSLGSCLVLGWVLDAYGPRICSVVGQLSIVIGVFLFAIASDFSMFALAAILIGFGGPGIQLSIVHVANLFPKNQYLVLCGLNGCISLSVSVFAIFDYLHTHYPDVASVRVLFGSFMPVVIVSLIASVIFWPDEPYEAPDEEDHCITDPFWEPTPEDVFVEATIGHHQHLLAEQSLGSYLRENKASSDGHHRAFSRTKSYLVSTDAIQHGEESLVDLKDQPFSKQVFSATYARSVLVFVVTCFLANFYISSFSTEMADFQDYTRKEQHHLVQLFSLAMSLQLVLAFFVGWLMDHVGQVVCIALTIVLGQIQLLVLVFLGDKEGWIIFSFSLYSLFRAFLFPAYIAGLTSRLGFKYFGLLSAIGFALSGFSQTFMASVVGFIQGDCHLMETFDPADSASDCFPGYWKELHIFEIAVLCVLLLAPVFEHIERTQRDAKLNRFLMQRQDRYSYGSITAVQEEDGNHADG